MVPRWLRKPLSVLIVFGALLLIWQGALFLALLRPAFTQIGIVSVPSMPSQGLTYARLGITAPVTVSAATSPLETQSWGQIRQALTQGVSLAFDGPTFTEARLAFLTGHSSDTYPHAYSTVFAPLGQSAIGDEFELRLAEQTSKYRVQDRQTLSPTATERFLALAPADGQPNRVVLVTCWPPLTTNQRLVVVGEQVVE